MGLEKDHIIYTAEDIQKYLDGKLAPAEMHAMEKAALDDAFLAEAIEGYEGMRQKDWENQLAYLKDHFSKNEPAKVIPLRPGSRFAVWKVAAAILVVCSGLGIVYLTATKQSFKNKPVAIVNKKPDTSTRPVGAPIIPDIDTQTLAKNNTVARNETKAFSQLKVATETRETDADSSFIYRPRKADKPVARQEPGGGYLDDSQKTNKGFIASNNAAPASENNTELYKNNKTIPTRQEAVDYFKKTTPLVMRKFAAQIVAPDGTPLPFANITITKDNIGTYADAKGYFRLVSADSILNVEIKSAGYLTLNYTLATGLPQNKIVLSEDELALKEKTQVTGNTSTFLTGKKRSAILVPDSVINVEPEDGWNNYDTYITNNLSVSKDILKKKIHGEVEVSFDVQSDGAITNVKVDKPLCGDCDEAALRVIKEGPRWKVKKGNQSTGKVRVKF